MARTIFDLLADIPPADRVAKVGTADSSLLGLHNMGPDEAAGLAFGRWACPEYLAGALGIEYRCPDPPGGSPARCRKCAAAFLKMRI